MIAKDFPLISCKSFAIMPASLLCLAWARLTEWRLLTCLMRLSLKYPIVADNVG